MDDVVGKNFARLPDNFIILLNKYLHAPEAIYFESLPTSTKDYMFKQELKDLELCYRKDIIEYSNKIEITLPWLVEYMEEFVSFYRKKEEVKEKLENLMEKLES